MIMVNPDDIHSFDKKYETLLLRLDNSQISEKNKELIHAFARGMKKSGNKKSTYMEDTSIALRMVEFYKKDLDTIIESNYDRLIEKLEVKGRGAPSIIAK
jgi:hypothetical protein